MLRLVMSQQTITATLRETRKNRTYGYGPFDDTENRQRVLRAAAFHWQSMAGWRELPDLDWAGYS